MTPRHRILVAIATIVLPTPLWAQAGDSLVHPVVPGDTVRLHEKSTVLVHGILVRRDSTGLVVVDRRTRDTVHIPLFQITSAEVQRGSHRLGGSAVGSGAAAGAAVGGVIFALALASPDNNGEKGLGIVIGGGLALMTTAVGSAAGLLVSFTHTETWASFDPAAVPLQPVDAPR